MSLKKKKQTKLQDVSNDIQLVFFLRYADGWKVGLVGHTVCLHVGWC